MRARYWIVFGIALAVIFTLFITDPAAGLISFERVPASAIALLSAFSVFIAIGLAHIGRKGMFDWFDMEMWAQRAYEEPTGAGLVVLGVCYVLGQMITAFAGALPK